MTYDKDSVSITIGNTNSSTKSLCFEVVEKVDGKKNPKRSGIVKFKDDEMESRSAISDIKNSTPASCKNKGTK